MRDDVVTFFSPILLLSTHLYILIASLSRRLGGQKNVVWPNDDDDFDLCLTDAGVEAATTLSGGMIRMIDRGRGLIQPSFLLQSLDLAQGKCP